MPATLVLNEVLSRNVAAWVDPDSGECPEHDDVVELYNAGAAPIALERFSIADSSGEPFGLPALDVAPGGHVTLVADDSDAPFHLPFGVSAYGDRLTLWEGSEVVDEVDVPVLAADTSWGRWGDGGRWRVSTPTPGEANESPPADPCFATPVGFDDHTFPCLVKREGFDAAAVVRAGTSVVKFEILGFPGDSELEIHFLDSRFYSLHDEWYLFRMMNGQTVRGESRYQPFRGDFADIRALYDWASERELGSLFPTEFITFTDTGRLTSSRFYELALGTPRRIGAGTLIHLERDVAGDERWAFELEHSDDIVYGELVSFFEQLDRRTSIETGSGTVSWLVRSAEQEEVASEMEQQGLPYADRIVRYEELSSPGETEVYRGGTVAGRVRIVRAGTDTLADARSTDILVLEEVPDYLPPCAALVTAVPQTPLAHVALLAESRGIPNLSVTGITSDPRWDAWGRVRRPVVLRATAPDGLGYRELTDEEWSTWLLLQEPSIGELVEVDGSTAPWVVDLATLAVEDMPEVRATFGGKSAGYLALLHTDGVEVPAPVWAVSIRAYQAHLDPLAPTVDAVLADPAFASPGDEELRYLVLEGTDAFDERYPQGAVVRDGFLADHAASTTLGGLARADGLRGLVAGAPLPREVERNVTDALASIYADLAPEQGLRFRSSSNVEDVEGFVGAGLYTSNTGYLDPEFGDPLPVALRETFASYWGAEAFEERHSAGLDHAAGAMGVTVHPNFDDDAELANGVLHLSRLPDGSTELTVNSQLGALSVTNPPVDACRLILPEVAVVRDGGAIERQQASTELPDGQVLTDGDLLDLWTQVAPVLETWMRVDNLATDDARDRTVLTLDLEFRKVDDGWPRYADGTELPSRIVVKQCRSLEPAPAGIPEEVTALPVPKDVLARAKVVEERDCDLPGGPVVVTTVTTDPALTPDLGYAERPFVALVQVGGEVLDWRDLEEVTGTSADDLAVTYTDVVATRLGSPGFTLEGAGCVSDTSWASPVTYLDDLLDGD